MIQVISETLDTEAQRSCVTRCRRFGKSMAAHMLNAYYDKSCDSRCLFEDLAIARLPSFEEHQNKYPTIYVDMSDFTTDYRDNPDIVNTIQLAIKRDVCKAYPNVEVGEPCNLMDMLLAIAESTRERFIMIIDEWDILCRDFEKTPEVVDRYVDWQRRMFKGGKAGYMFVGVYMTGILPTKKHRAESALNDFNEYSMIDPGSLAPSFGFTPSEVETLAQRYEVGIDELKLWYDGYRIGDEPSMYNSYSIMRPVQRHKCRSYWQATSSYDKVSTYIQMNFEGLKDDILKILAGESVWVNTVKFGNDLNDIRSRDDVLTVLVHLGYLSYCQEDQTCHIPNKEVADESSNVVEDTSWTEVVRITQNSKSPLEATWDGEEQAVAQAIDKAHQANASILSYNNENSLSCVPSIAYIWAQNEYIFHREFATGKGYAGLVMIPRRKCDRPALVIELKYNTVVNTAIDQIRKKNYLEKIKGYTDNILLVGISYDKGEDAHTCRIEREWARLGRGIPHSFRSKTLHITKSSYLCSRNALLAAHVR